MNQLDKYIQQASKDGHVRSGIILGIRMNLVGLQQLEIEDPRQHHRTLVVIVETDRCLPDTVQLVAGCRLANRTLKLKDFGKMAATFIDLKSNRAVRVAATEAANRRAFEMFPDLEKEQALQRSYRLMSNDELFTVRRGRVRLLPQDVPGYSAPRVICTQCDEDIAFGRELLVEGKPFCRSCAGDQYFESL